MKTRRQKDVLKYIRKYIAVALCIILCASFFVVPVSAAEDYSVVFESPTSTNPYLFAVGAGTVSDPSPTEDASWADLQVAKDTRAFYYNDVYAVAYTFDWIEANQGIVSFDIGSADFGLEFYTMDNVAWLDPGKFTLEVVEEDYISFYNYRFVLRPCYDFYDYGPVIAATDIQSFYMNGLSQDYVTVSYPRLDFKFRDSASSPQLELILEVFGSSLIPENRVIVSYEDKYTMHYAPTISPNIPLFPSAPGQGEIDNYSDSEQALIGSQASSMQQGLDSMNNVGNSLSSMTSLFDFGRLTLMLGNIMDRLMLIPGFSNLVNISLGLGLFASLLSLSAAIVSASDRKAEQANREAARAARSDKKK